MTDTADEGQGTGPGGATADTAGEDGAAAVFEFMMGRGWEPEDLARALAAHLRELAAERREAPDKVVRGGVILPDPHDLAAADRWNLMAQDLERAAAR